MNTGDARNADLCAVILAGGQSRRMGRNKALIQVESRPLIARVAEQALRLTNQVFVSSNDAGVYDFLGLPALPDLYPGQGPLAGLHAAFMNTDRPLVLLLACDLPALHDVMLRRLLELCQGHDAVIPRTTDGRLHPLCGIYRRTCLNTIEHNVRKGINKMTDLFRDGSLRVKFVDGRDGRFDDSNLRNLNTPEDLEAYTHRHS
jgi:molybdopterin-guanine dinucleotide biosynthesis protein A